MAIISQVGARDNFFKAIKENGIVLVYDLETTGLDPVNDRPIQISVRKCAISDDGLQEYGHESWYLNPGFPLPEKITELTGITDDFLSDKPSEDDVFSEIEECFGTHPVCGYNNARFDDSFMQNLFERHGTVFKPDASMDVFPVAKAVIMPDETVNYKLATVTDFFGFTDEVEQFHNADGDTMATELVFGALMERCRKEAAENAPGMLIKADPVNCAYWRGNYGVMPRIYVEAVSKKGSAVTFWIDPITGEYHTKNRNDDISRYDVEYLETKVRGMIGCDYRDYR